MILPTKVALRPRHIASSMSPLTRFHFAGHNVRLLMVPVPARSVILGSDTRVDAQGMGAKWLRSSLWITSNRPTAIRSSAGLLSGLLSVASPVGHWNPNIARQRQQAAILASLSAVRFPCPSGIRPQILCGHTHSSRQAKILDNLEVLAGKAKYGEPAVQLLLDVD